jgi:hypothetical protein
MTDSLYEQEILDRLGTLNAQQQREVLEYVRNMAGQPRGTPGILAVQYAREINFAPEDLVEMQQLISDCFDAG